MLSKPFDNSLLTVVEAGTFYGGSQTKHCIFFSIIEILTTIVITWISLKWKSADFEKVL
jgi:hypothetical protein